MMRRLFPAFSKSGAAAPLLCALVAVLFAATAVAAAADLPPKELTDAEEAELQAMALPLPQPWFGDFDGMRERRLVRILVPFSRTLFFIDRGRQLGIAHDMGAAFEEQLNRKHGSKTLKIRVAFIPVPNDRLLSDLQAGLGDIAAGELTITPSRLEKVDFSAPLASNVAELVVAGPASPPLDGLDDLAGKTVHVRASSSYHEHLAALSGEFVARGLPPIDLQAAEEDLDDVDLMEMVGAGLLPLTVVDGPVALFWEDIVPDLKVREDLAVHRGGDIAWAIRKDSPQLKAEVDAFAKTHRIGTAFGNIVLKRYLKEKTYLHRAQAPEAAARFERLIDLFRQYAGSYSFDHLMILAQGYQESQLDQSRRSPRGAVGIMQLLPSTAADPAVGIKGVETSAERNIQAGVKYLALLRDTYLDDAAIDDKNRTLMSFAAYNAGPGNLRKFRRFAAENGLDPNVWFYNVEVAAARIVGRETVQYVSNIYKYYVAYRLVRERELRRQQLRSVD